MVINFRTSLIFLFVSLAGCTIRPPDVNITSEKTALEKQMFGDKVKITNNPSSLIAVWSIMNGSSLDVDDEYDMSGYQDEYYKRKLMLAQVRRRTMLEFINELKRQGLVGESRGGELAVMVDSIPRTDPVYRMVESENKDRDIILEFYCESRGIEGELEKTAVKSEFAHVTARVSPDSTWIEDYDGNWAKK